jgi:tetratricopeptide (TPR) repeat protein
VIRLSLWLLPNDRQGRAREGLPRCLAGQRDSVSSTRRRHPAIKGRDRDPEVLSDFPGRHYHHPTLIGRIRTASLPWPGNGGVASNARQHILMLVEAGDREGVRLACEDLLKRFGNTTDAVRANSLASYCVLAPDAVSDREAPVRLAEAALTDHPESGRARGEVLNTLGATLYRADRFEEAIHRLNESISTSGSGDGTKGFAFLALAHHRLGHRDEAKRWLDKLIASQPREGFDISLEDMQIRILRREAESLILGSTPAVPPTAPATPTRNASGDPGAKPE